MINDAGPYWGNWGGWFPMERQQPYPRLEEESITIERCFEGYVVTIRWRLSPQRIACRTWAEVTEQIERVFPEMVPKAVP